MRPNSLFRLVTATFRGDKTIVSFGMEISWDSFEDEKNYPMYYLTMVSIRKLEYNGLFF